jgi:hypothetical protein
MVCASREAHNRTITIDDEHVEASITPAVRRSHDARLQTDPRKVGFWLGWLPGGPRPPEH